MVGCREREGKYGYISPGFRIGRDSFGDICILLSQKGHEILWFGDKENSPLDSDGCFDSGHCPGVQKPLEFQGSGDTAYGCHCCFSGSCGSHREMLFGKMEGKHGGQSLQKAIWMRSAACIDDGSRIVLWIFQYAACSEDRV
nr:hypothetical protein [uncultured Acetatifactor sp.]